MRISDWSADVCASDLRERRQRQRILVGGDQRRIVVPAQEGPAPDQRADTGDQDDDAGERPEDILGRGKVAGQRLGRPVVGIGGNRSRSEEHTSELKSLMRNSYAVFCLKKKSKPLIQANNS